ncbi:hypothetical protein VPH35_027102 [Triticum aestivum]|uniref:autophagy-related protein 18d-like n=1 Tax=Triticum aestivum TaxID=4565 RepID=UPI00162D08FE|nr:autophagy-related protein 18d-like [Triticum aestivum]
MAPSSSSPAATAEADSPIVHVAFSSGASHFVASTATGFHVFSCDEKVERVHYKSDAVASPGVVVTSAGLLTRSRVAVVTRTTGAVEGAAEHHAIYFWDEESKPGSVDVHAHASSLSCIALSRDGRLLATAGSKGTLVRIFTTDDGAMVQELRRGIDRADIHCITFSPDSRWLAVSSDKGTVHVFPVASVDKATSTTEGGDGNALPVAPSRAAASPPAPAAAKQGSLLPSFLKGYLPSYFSSEWSLAQVRLREGVEYAVEFCRQHANIILIVGTDGSFYRCGFDPLNTGEMKQLEHRRFMKTKESEDSQRVQSET